MNSKVKILIVDDEVLIAEFIKDVLMSLDFKLLSLAHTKEDAIKEINVFKPDLILLDIRMENEFDGIEIAKEINSNFKIPFIFITAHSDKEIIEKALNTIPSGYITKPIKKMDVYAAINLAIRKTEVVEEQFITFKDGYDTVKLSFNDILYAESEGNYINIFTLQKKYAIRNSLEWFISNMPKNGFEKVQRSYVVNMKKVHRATSKSLFINDIEIPISRGKQIDLS
jgi:DNA-binding LytR/AlgR family response regulator